MQSLIDFGISLVADLQGMGDWAIPVMTFFSQLGSEDFFFLILPLIYWSVDFSLGIRIGFILATSAFFNMFGKIAFVGPRPYWVSSEILPLWPETGFGVPSGHAQNAMSVWGMIAARVKRTWATVVCALLIFMIGFSRLVLGAHFPHDVLVGWLLGGALLWAFNRYWDAAASWISGKTFAQQAGMAFLVAALFMIAGLAVTGWRSSFEMPQDWTTNALRSGVEPYPVERAGFFTVGGTFFGLAVGAAWIHSRGGYQAQGPVWKRAVRYLVGLVGILLFWMALGEIFPRGEGLVELSLRFLRYALVGGWISGGAPRVFKYFNLTAS